MSYFFDINLNTIITDIINDVIFFYKNWYALLILLSNMWLGWEYLFCSALQQYTPTIYASLLECAIWNEYASHVEIALEAQCALITPEIYKIVVFIALISIGFLIIIQIIGFMSLTNTMTNILNSTVITKFTLFFEAEKEWGAFDDWIFFILLLISSLTWYFLIISIIFLFNIIETWLTQTIIFIVCGILAIPTSLFLKLGLSVGVYLRGTGTTSSIIAEIILDFIAILIVGIRFIVQNIRFVLILLAFIELLEWIFDSAVESYNANLCVIQSILNDSDVTIPNLLMLVSSVTTLILFYIYYTMHLICLLFMQVGVYLLVSYWLFFFFYTTFFNKRSLLYFAIIR